MALWLRLVLTVLSCAVAAFANTPLYETKRACAATWKFATVRLVPHDTVPKFTSSTLGGRDEITELLLRSHPRILRG
jgi:hypothetical protein